MIFPEAKAKKARKSKKKAVNRFFRDIEEFVRELVENGSLGFCVYIERDFRGEFQCFTVRVLSKGKEVTTLQYDEEHDGRNPIVR